VGALNRLLARLSKSIAAQQAFIGDAAHELRTPLTALRLQAQLVARARDDEKRESAAEVLVAGIDRATHLVEQLLTLARSEPDTVSRTFVPVRLDGLVLDVVAQHAGTAYARGIDLGVRDVGPLSVSGDADDLRILLRNLISNAIRYTPVGGRIDVSVTARDGDPVIEVDDSGPGIPGDERERVLDRFYRRPGGDSQGSGLGLSIVKAIAERHGAAVNLSEAPGGGLAVRIVFHCATGFEPA
jgi:two-component system OmpR family sensor kinase